MASVPQLVVGLGNPGRRHAGTRHNAGFWFVDRLAAQGGGRFAAESRFHGEVARIDADRGGCWLLKPSTFMNDSGRSVQSFISYYNIAPADVLVVHDEVDFPAGVARLKRGGGHGGHNGLRDLVACIGPEFLRLRIGVGHPGNKDEVVSFVLNRPTAAEQEQIDGAIGRALGIMPQLLAGEFERAVQALHTTVEAQDGGDAAD